MNIYIPPIIEKVYNVQGSTAGAGSGEFHRYRAMRRRERTRIAAMEKEYKERRKQKEFDDIKETRIERLQHAHNKKKERREKRKEKKRFIQEVKKATEGTQIFDRNIPLIEQIKNELGEEEFKKLNQDKQQIEDFENKPQKQGAFKIRRENNFNKDALMDIINSNKSDTQDEKYINADDEQLRKLFPQSNKISDLYETFDEYEENLEIMDLIEKNKDYNQDDQNSENIKEQEEVKYKELEENIIIHEYD